MTNKELAASLLIEAVGLLEESYGAHGVYGKIAEERGLDKIATKDKALRKVGAPYSKVNNSLKAEVHYSDEARDIANSINKRTNPKKYSNVDSKINARAERKEYATFRGKEKADCVYSQNAKDIDNVYAAGNRRMEQHKRKSKKLYERINGRAKSQNETIEALLNECYELLEETSILSCSNIDTKDMKNIDNSEEIIKRLAPIISKKCKEILSEVKKKYSGLCWSVDEKIFDKYTKKPTNIEFSSSSKGDYIVSVIYDYYDEKFFGGHLLCINLFFDKDLKFVKAYETLEG